MAQLHPVFGMLCAAAALIPAALPATAHAQVVEATAFTSLLNAQVNAPLGVWQYWSLVSQGYGLGSNANGASGNWTHTYVGGQISNITVNLGQLRNTNDPFVTINNPFAHIWGRIQFTATANTPYTIGGSVDLALSGSASSSSSASGLVWLEQVGGPSLAAFGASTFRNTNSSNIVNIYDSASPYFGSNTGMLLAGVTYRLNYDFRVDSLINGDPGLYADVYTLNGPQYFSITFPTPGAAALLGLAGLTASRRRR